jgi:hypothetical protein
VAPYPHTANTDRGEEKPTMTPDDTPHEKMTIDLNSRLGSDESKQETCTALVTINPLTGKQAAKSNGDKQTDGQETTDRIQDTDTEWGEGVVPPNDMASPMEMNFDTPKPSKKLRTDRDWNT